MDRLLNVYFWKSWKHNCECCHLRSWQSVSVTSWTRPAHVAKASTMSNYQAGTIKTDKQSLTCRKAFLLTPHTLLWPGHMSPVPSARHMVCCRLSLGKTSHAMPCNTIHDLIATRTSHGLLSPVTGKTSHVMSCHTIHILIAIRISRGLLLPVTGENKSCHVISCHATLYMSLLPSERHTVCCRLSLGEASHAMSVPTIPYNTAISTPHGLLSPLTGGSKSCHVSPYNTIQHCNQHATRFAVDSLWGNKVTPHTYHISYHITPYYSILHHIHHFTLYHTIHHATLYNIHYTTHTLYIYIIPYVYNTTHHTAS